MNTFLSYEAMGEEYEKNKVHILTMNGGIFKMANYMNSKIKIQLYESFPFNLAYVNKFLKFPLF